MEQFKTSLEKDISKEYMKKLSVKTSIDEISLELENIFTRNAKNTLKVTKLNKDCKKANKIDWMNNECFKRKKELNKYKKQFLENTSCMNRREKYMHEKKKLKRFLYFTKSAVINNKMNKLGSLVKKDPAYFWKSVKKLTSSSKKGENNCIPPKMWQKYFTGLLYNPKQKVKENNFVAEGPLDYKFDKTEIIKSMKTLRKNKAASTSVTNDMILCNIDLLGPVFTIIFNKVLKQGVYPKLWNVSHIIPVFKTGEQQDPGNYRGVCVGNAIGKLFNKCLNSRIEKYLTDNKILKENSMGFRKGYRTEDAIFTLKTVQEKYNKMNKRVFTTFVDFSKFYDRIDHTKLFEKLFKIGISGAMFLLIQDMYLSLSYQIKLLVDQEYMLTDMFKSNIGLKQGCPLSPTLANIYLNDIHDDMILSDIDICGHHTNSITWADDLVLFSLSHAGMQKILKNLEEYCKRWMLTINMKKSKCMIMGSTETGHIFTNHFMLNDTCLDYVQSYKYLGIDFSQNGKFTLAIENRVHKARNAIFSLRKACYSMADIAPNVEILKQLFQSKIIPILTYGCAIWGPSKNNKIKVEDILNDAQSAHLLNTIIPNTSNEIKSFRRTRFGTIIELKDFKTKINILEHVELQRKKITDFTLNKPYEKIEKIQNHFYRNCLGVSKYTAIKAVQYEVGAYPISVHIKTAFLTYWYKLHTQSMHNLINLVFAENKQISSKWEQGVYYTLYDTALGHIKHSTEAIQIIKRIIKVGLQQNHIKKLEKDLWKSNKFYLNEHRSIKKYTLQPYVKTIKDPNIRRTLTQMRTGSHKLNAVKNKEDVYCPVCGMEEKETVLHFIERCADSHLIIHRTKIKEALGITNNIATILLYKHQNTDEYRLKTGLRHLHQMYRCRIASQKCHL